MLRQACNFWMKLIILTLLWCIHIKKKVKGRALSKSTPLVWLLKSMACCCLQFKCFPSIEDNTLCQLSKWSYHLCPNITYFFGDFFKKKYFDKFFFVLFLEFLLQSDSLVSCGPFVSTRWFIPATHFYWMGKERIISKTKVNYTNNGLD